MYRVSSKILLLASVCVLIATSPNEPLEAVPAPTMQTICVSEPLSLTLGPDNMSQELGLTFENLNEDNDYNLTFEHTGIYSGQGAALLTISALDENGEIMEGEVIDTELRSYGGEFNNEQEWIGVLDLNRDFLIEWNSSSEYSFDLAVTVTSLISPYDSLPEQCEAQWE